MLPPGYEEGTSNLVLAVGSADASGHEAAPAAAMELLEGESIRVYDEERVVVNSATHGGV
jgi:5,10-methylene-tetrahydrofolate dehydrogenase/methenyl tetrahydrofolate cyclohydrolase